MDVRLVLSFFASVDLEIFFAAISCFSVKANVCLIASALECFVMVAVGMLALICTKFGAGQKSIFERMASLLSTRMPVMMGTSVS